MAVKLPTPREWLDEQLTRLGLSQNELAIRTGLASSAISNFTAGRSGHETAVRLANGLGVPPGVTLALLGLSPAPARWRDVEQETVAHIYGILDDQDRQMLLTFAEWLRERKMRSLHSKTESDSGVG